MCEACKEDEFNIITQVKVTIRHENPNAYGYPEIVNWNKRYRMENCPFCGRLLNNVNLDSEGENNNE